MADQPSIFEPRIMEEVVSRLAPVRTFFRSTFFNRIVTFPTKSITFDMKKGDRELAPFVNPEIGGKKTMNSGYYTHTYTPPLIAPYRMTTVKDIETRRPGESPYNSGKNPADRAVEKLAEDFLQLREMIVRREEWMCAQAIFRGQIPIIGDGVKETIEFDFTNKTDLSKNNAKKWTSPTSEKLKDLHEWRKTVQKNGLVNCNICVMADDVVEQFLQDENVKSTLDVKGYDLAVIKPKELPDGTTYIGSLHKEGMDIYSYNEWFLDDWTDPDNKTQMPLVPDGYIAILATTARYSMGYGAVTVLNEETRQFETIEAQYAPESWIERRPSRRFLQLSSHPIPVPHEVGSWFIAKVM